MTAQKLVVAQIVKKFPALMEPELSASSFKKCLPIILTMS
jgi:hypothetical protein